MLASGKKLPQKVYLPTHFVLTKEIAQILENNGMDLSNVKWVASDEAITLFHRAVDELGPGKLNY